MHIKLILIIIPIKFVCDF